jgi:hypothetical protein
LENCPPLLDGVEVWRIGRQKQQRAACRFNQLTRFDGLMEACIVHNHDMVGWQFGKQYRFNPLVEHIRIGVALEAEWGD